MRATSRPTVRSLVLAVLAAFAVGAHAEEWTVKRALKQIDRCLRHFDPF